MTTTPDLNEYATAEHALKYLAHADSICHRTEGEAVLLEFIPKKVGRILDLGTGENGIKLRALLDKLLRPVLVGWHVHFGPWFS